MKLWLSSQEDEHTPKDYAYYQRTCEDEGPRTTMMIMALFFEDLLETNCKNLSPRSIISRSRVIS